MFSTGTGSPQTVDVNDIKETTYFEVSSATEGGKNLVNVVNTGIAEVQTERQPAAQGIIYDLQGRRVSHPTHGIYIRDGKKFVVK